MLIPWEDARSVAEEDFGHFFGDENSAVCDSHLAWRLKFEKIEGGLAGELLKAGHIIKNDRAMQLWVVYFQTLKL